MQEIEVFHFNELLNDRGVGVDLKSIDKLVSVCDEIRNDYEDKVRALTGGMVDSAKAVSQAMKWIAKQGKPVPDLTARTIDQLLSPEIAATFPPQVVQFLEYRKIVSRSSIAKFNAFQETVSPDGKIHGMMFYHGAHTGRWTSKLVQLQNFPRGKAKLHDTEVELILTSLHNSDPREFIEWLEDKCEQEEGWVSPIEVISTLLRSMIVPDEGMVMLIYDYASIESRVLAWLADCKELLDAFKKTDSGEVSWDVYMLMASKIYKDDVESYTKSDPKRQHGKAVVLGCGYGMGPAKFHETCASQGLTLTEEEANNMVYSFRDSFAEIPQLWYRIDSVMKDVAKKVDSSPIKATANISLYRTNSFVFCRLPNGRDLAYPMMEVKNELNPYLGKTVEALSYMGSDVQHPWCRKKIYGAKAVENIVQAVARDLMVDAMLKLEKAGFEVLFSVHDEIVCQIWQEDCTPERIAQFEEIMTTVPEWATGLPIQVEGSASARYRK